MTETKREPMPMNDILERYCDGTQFIRCLAGLDSQAAIDLPELVEHTKRLQQWVSELQSGMYINCVYCGHRYGPDDEIDNMQDALKAHIEVCPEHPMSKLKAAVKHALFVCKQPQMDGSHITKMVDVLKAAIKEGD